LRIIGQDVAYGPHLSGSALVRTARREGRVILTRDTRLARRRDAPPRLLIVSDHFREQLRQVVSAYALDAGAAMLSRCLECNEELCEADRAQVRPRVPPYVWATQDRFATCRRCHRIYWGATHFERMREELVRLGLVSAP
jgi:hypothetical protein